MAPAGSFGSRDGGFHLARIGAVGLPRQQFQWLFECRLVPFPVGKTAGMRGAHAIAFSVTLVSIGAGVVVITQLKGTRRAHGDLAHTVLVGLAVAVVVQTIAQFHRGPLHRIALHRNALHTVVLCMTALTQTAHRLSQPVVHQTIAVVIQPIARLRRGPHEGVAVL
jgi:hypothetical protein